MAAGPVLCGFTDRPNASNLDNIHFKTHPDTKKPKELNAFQPMALTSLVVKFTLKFLQYILVSLVDGKLDPLHFCLPSW
jgi:hypothetical protein